MKSLLLLATLLVFPLAATAATYSWTDPSGNMHFTDDIGSVPVKYRVKALKKAAAEEGKFSSPVPDKAEDNTSTKESTKTENAIKESSSVPQGATGETRFGAHKAREWQEMLRSKRAELTLLEKKFEELRQETGNGKKMLTTQQINDINSRNKILNTEYEAARLRYNELVDQANKAGLPSEFTP